jgi:glyoxylate/hydroxypyruvate reductase A
MPADPALRSPEDGVLEQAVFGVLAVHRHLPQYIANQRGHVWHEVSFTPTAKRRVGVMGQGAIAEAVCRQLKALGFPVSAGDALQCDILLCVSTGELSEKICEEMCARLAPDASVVIVGEAGEPLLEALRAGLGDGRLIAACLALAGSEPLAPDDALWAHPHVMLAPLA